MNVRRGDVVLVLYPFASGRGASRRPALIVQNNRDNRCLDNTIIAQITTNMRHANDSTHLLIPWVTQKASKQVYFMIQWSRVIILPRSMRIGCIV